MCCELSMRIRLIWGNFSGVCLRRSKDVNNLHCMFESKVYLNCLSWKSWTIRILYVGHEINWNNGITWYLQKTFKKSNNNKSFGSQAWMHIDDSWLSNWSRWRWPMGTKSSIAIWIRSWRWKFYNIMPGLQSIIAKTGIPSRWVLFLPRFAHLKHLALCISARKEWIKPQCCFEILTEVWRRP